MTYDDNFEIKLIESNVELKSLASEIEKDNLNDINDSDILEGCLIPKKLKLTDSVICIRNKITKNIHSFIWFGIYNNNNNIPFVTNSDKIIYINYLYTFRKHRNNGYNKKLMLLVETYCEQNNIQYIVAVPLPGSNSKYVLEKLSYTKIDNYYMKKINIFNN